MNIRELAEYNVGENLDQIMNLDPRGYGVCRILYAGSRSYTGEATTMHCARELGRLLKPGDVVFLITGFILRPHKQPETDGSVSTVLLARGLIQAYGVTPVIICPEENKPAFVNMVREAGLHLYDGISEAAELPLSVGIVAFTKDKDRAASQAEQLLAEGNPKAVISNEAPGANCCGEYHNAVGVNCTELEAKMDVLFRMAKEKGIWNMAIGDLGNEIGMGAIKEHILKYIPYTGAGECSCGCGGGILADSATDHIITATVSDWGCYGLLAATAYLKGDISIMHTEEMEESVLKAASQNGLVDMTGSLLPGIDGFDCRMNRTIVSLMRQCVEYSLGYDNEKWFDVTLQKEFFQQNLKKAL